MPCDYVWSSNHPAAASAVDWQRGAARRRPSDILGEGEAGGLPRRALRAALRRQRRLRPWRRRRPRTRSRRLGSRSFCHSVLFLPGYLLFDVLFQLCCLRSFCLSLYSLSTNCSMKCVSALLALQAILLCAQVVWWSNLLSSRWSTMALCIFHLICVHLKL